MRILFVALIIIFFNTVQSCSYNVKTQKNSKDEMQLFKYGLKKYCINYDDVDNYSVKFGKESIFNNWIKYAYNLNENYIDFNWFKKQFLKNNQKIMIPVKIIGDKIKFFGTDKIIEKSLFFKKLFVITIKKEINREYDSDGNISVYYYLNEIYLTEDIIKVYSFSRILHFEQDSSELKIKSIEYRATKKEIMKLIGKISKNLGFYFFKNKIKITKDNKSNNWTVFIYNKIKKVIKILVDEKNKHIKGIIYFPIKRDIIKVDSIYNIHNIITNPYKYNGEFDCKPKK